MIVIAIYLTVTDSIIAFYASGLASGRFIMIFSDRVLLTCLEHQKAPMNSNTLPSKSLKLGRMTLLIE